MDALGRYLAVDPQDKDMIAKRLEAVSGAAHQEAAHPQGSGPIVSPDATAQSLVEKSKAAAEQKDWLSAHYYAQAAAALDPRRVDALRLASESENELARSTQSQKDDAAGRLFLRKKEALSRLENNDPFGAYYSFLTMASENAGDPDIARYLEEARTEVRKAAFFVDDALKVEMLPGTEGILFLNRNDADSAEAVWVGKMVELPGGDAYFFDIEAVRYDASGAVAWHFAAPYGRRDGDSILMNAVDSHDATSRFQPVYLQGGRSAAERNLLRLLPSVEELRALSSGTDRPCRYRDLGHVAPEKPPGHLWPGAPVPRCGNDDASGHAVRVPDPLHLLHRHGMGAAGAAQAAGPRPWVSSSCRCCPWRWP